LTGKSDLYESPLHAGIVINTDRETVQESAPRIIAKLEELNLIPNRLSEG
jgi:adenylylsulfate kinase-like enzyme